MNDALLTTQDQQEKISRLYVDAVATKAGYVVWPPPEYDRDGVDIQIRAGGGMRPAIDVQLKATINLKGPIKGPNGETYRFRLKNRNYRLLQKESWTPRLLVVLHMPRDKSQWITIVNDGLTLRRCAYWLNLREFDELDEDDDDFDEKYTTVQIPQENRFDDVSLRRLMDQARTGRIE